VQSQSTPCANNRVCPSDKVCDDAHGLCVDQSQIDACVGLDQFSDCDAADMGRCYEGICLAGGCGNSIVDPPDLRIANDVPEACDDGNRNAGDGCSSDCKSEEVCANNVVDLINNETCDDGNALNHDGCSSLCASEGARWVTLSGFFARSQHAMAYDSFRDRVVLFGGLSNTNQYLGNTYENDGHRWHPMAPAQEPSPRLLPVMAYDAKRHVTVLFGGHDGVLLGDTWEWNGAQWKVAITPVAPSPRFHSTMVYDAARERVLLIGGAAGATVFDDTWAWDGLTWTQLSVTTPKRYAHVAIYDPVRKVTVLYGGSDGTAQHDTWELDDTAWTQKATAGGPSLAVDLTGAFDPVASQPLLIDNNNAAWHWTGSTWVQTIGVWTSLDAAAVTDSARRRVLAFGRVADTWTFNGTAWTRQPGSNDSGPQAMFGFGLARDPSKHRVVLYGGSTNETVALATTWQWDGTWTSLGDVTGIPGARWWPGFVYDEAAGKFLLFGGSTSATQQVAATYSSPTANPNDWTAETTPAGLTARLAPIMVYDAERANVLLFGGGFSNSSGDGDFNDTWTWNGTWTQQAPSNIPIARRRAAAAYDPIRKRVVMFGGFNVSGPNYGIRNDTWEWDGAEWHDMAPSVSPPARDGGVLAWDAGRQRIVLMGGAQDQNGARDDTWEWDGQVWTQIATSQSPGARSDHAMFSAFEGGGVIAMRGGLRDPNFGTLSAPTTLKNTVQLQRDSNTPDEGCLDGADVDSDGKAGCADLDCWNVCSPSCPPGTSCVSSTPHCGDSSCNTTVEDCATCPADCGPC
jgi:cysteine-rich repeat protein